MIQLHDSCASVADLDRRWRRVMERRVRTQCGPRLAALFDAAWSDLLCATWRSGRPAIEDEGQMWAVLQTFIGFAQGKQRRPRRELAASDLGADLQFFEDRRQRGPSARASSMIAAERRRGGHGFEAVWLVHAIGMSYNEAAQVQGVGVERFKSRLKAGRASLRRRWAGKDLGAMWTSEQRSAVEQAIGEAMQGDPAQVAHVLAALLEELGIKASQVLAALADN